MVRILQRILALTAAIWHNDHTAAPVHRSLTAYDHSAPRGALSYPRFSREELGGRFLGLMAYLDPKVKGTIACQESSGCVQAYGTGRCGTRAIWLKLDCLNPNLQLV